MAVGVCAAAALVWAQVGTPGAEASGQSSSLESPDAATTQVFNDLFDSQVAALRARDKAALREVFLRRSPLLADLRKSIHELHHGGAFFRTKYLNSQLWLVQAGDDSMVIRQTVDIYPKFVVPGFGDHTTPGQAVRQTADWTLRNRSGRWYFDDARVVAEQPLGVSDPSHSHEGHDHDHG